MTHAEWKKSEDKWLKIIEGIEKKMPFISDQINDGEPKDILNGIIINDNCSFCLTYSNCKDKNRERWSCGKCPLYTKRVCEDYVTSCCCNLKNNNYSDALTEARKVLAGIRKYEPWDG